MKHKFILISALALLSSLTSPAQGTKASKPQTENSKTDYLFERTEIFDQFIPQTPVLFMGKIPVWGSKEVNGEENILNLINDQDKLKKMLPDFSVDFYIKKFNADGKPSYGLTGVTGEPGSYEIVYDIAKHTTVLTSKEGETCETFVKVGVGIRIRANIMTTEARVDVSSLSHLAEGSKASLLIGGLSYQIFGIEGKDVMNLSPTANALIDVNSVNSFMQSLAVLKTRILDTDITLVPRVYAHQKINCTLLNTAVGQR